MSRAISTDAAPEPAGHYVQGRVHAGTLYVSGQLPIDPETGHQRLDSIEVQTKQALENVAAIVSAAGSSLEDILKVTVYVADIALWDRVNAVYADFFGEHRPARAVVPTRDLHGGVLVEIEAVAAARGEGAL